MADLCQTSWSMEVEELDTRLRSTAQAILKHGKLWRAGKRSED